MYWERDLNYGRTGNYWIPDTYKNAVWYIQDSCGSHLFRKQDIKLTDVQVRVTCRPFCNCYTSPSSSSITLQFEWNSPEFLLNVQKKRRRSFNSKQFWGLSFKYTGAQFQGKLGRKRSLVVIQAWRSVDEDKIKQLNIYFVYGQHFYVKNKASLVDRFIRAKCIWITFKNGSLRFLEYFSSKLHNVTGSKN